jgi:hypothetical protein
MPDLKISQLPVATTPLTGAELVPVVQGGTTDRATVADFLKSAVAGSAAAPSFAFSADPNTGVFSPAADTFAVTTGGTERLRVDSAGNVGIGSTAPLSPVTVHNATANTPAVEIRGGGSSSQSILVFTYGNAASATATNGRIFTSTSEFSIRAEASQPLTFAVGGSERMRLNASGNLGLGVTPSAWGTSVSQKVFQFGPVGSLSSLSASANNQQVNLANNAVDFSSPTTYLTTDTAQAYRMLQGEHRWFNAPSGTAGTAITFTQAMTLDASGNLGIGTTSPATRFDVRRDGTDIFQARIINKDAAVGATRAVIQFENDVGVAGYVGTHGSNSGASLGGAYAGALVLQGDNANGVRVVAANGSGVFSVNTGSTSSANLRLIVNSVGNLGLGTSTFGTSAATVFSIANGTEPSTGPADTVQFFSVDRSAGNTIPGIYCEGTGVTDAAITNVTVTNKIAIKVNGTVYYLLATTSAA